jgi:hypothetical protein
LAEWAWRSLVADRRAHRLAPDYTLQTQVEHPVLEGRRQYRIDRRHRTGPPQARTPDRPTMMIGRIGDHVPLRSLAIYEAIGASLAMERRP